MQQARRPHEEEPQEELLTWFLRLWKMGEDNSSKILTGVGIVVVAAVIVVFVQQQNTAGEEAAQQAMGEVYISIFQQDIAAAISKSEQVVKDHASQPVAQEALMAMANLNFEEGRIDEARKEFQKYMDQYGTEGPLGYGAWIGLAACLEHEQAFSSAADRFASYAQKYPQEPFSVVALKEAGRCYELAGDLEKAKQTYQQLLDQYSASSVANVVRGKLQMMGVVVDS